MSVQAN